MCRMHPWTTGVMVTAITTGTPLCALPCLVSFEPELRVEFSSDSKSELDPLVAEVLGSVYRSIESGTSAELSSPVEALRDLPLTRHEQAHVYQADGHLWSERFEFELAIAAFERSLSLDVLSRRDARNLDFNLGKLYRVVGSSGKAIDATLRWFDGAETPSSDDFYEVIAAFWMEDRTEEALAWAELAKTSGARDLSLEYQKAILQLELGRTDELERDFRELVSREPEYAAAVLDLISYESLDDAARLRLMEFADSVDLLDGYQKVELAELYRRMDRPYRAAVLMERALYDRALEPDASRWLLLAESWLAVPDRGRAAEPLERAAELSGEPKLHERLGSLLLELRRWTAAEDALRTALAGGVRDARLLLFAALFSQGRFEDARKVLAPPEPPAAQTVQPAPDTEPGGPAPEDASACLGVALANEAESAGALVTAVQLNSPAARAGLLAGDVIVQLGARQLRSGKELVSEVGDASPGQGFSVIARRDGAHFELRGLLGARTRDDRNCSASVP